MLTGAELAQRLCVALEDAGIPFDGVSIQDGDDRATWKVRLLDDATPEQHAAAAQLLAGVDLDAPAIAEKRATAVAGARLDSPELTAIMAALVDQLRALGATVTLDDFRVAAVGHFVTAAQAADVVVDRQGGAPTR